MRRCSRGSPTRWLAPRPPPRSLERRLGRCGSRVGPRRAPKYCRTSFVIADPPGDSPYSLISRLPRARLGPRSSMSTSRSASSPARGPSGRRVVSSDSCGSHVATCIPCNRACFESMLHFIRISRSQLSALFAFLSDSFSTRSSRLMQHMPQLTPHASPSGQTLTLSTPCVCVCDPSAVDAPEPRIRSEPRNPPGSAPPSVDGRAGTSRHRAA